LHYTGLDDKNQPYAIQAAQATKPAGLSGIYDMVKPEGDITLENGAWIDGKADLGRYDTVGKRLWLGGNVHFFHNKGYEFTTDEAQINIGNHEAWGDKPVLLKGNMGTVRGRGFRFLDSGNTVVIEGPATALLNLQRQDKSDTPGAVQSLP
jgi:lipopolysaccharide export system protein LptC